MTNNHFVKTDSYEGPLDLLLGLIEKEKLDICEISLAKITNDYLRAIVSLRISEEEMANFVLIATKLLYIKSKALLPSFPEEPEENEISLEAQLLEYKKYKEKAEILSTILSRNLRSYEANVMKIQPEVFIAPKNIDLNTMMNLLNEVINRIPKEEESKQRKIVPRVTLEQKLADLKKSLVTNKTISFRKFLEKSKSKSEVVITFLAVLEMLKRKIISVKQKKIFGDITIESI